MLFERIREAKSRFVLWLWPWLGFVMIATAAADDDTEYLRRLQIAQHKVERKQQVQNEVSRILPLSQRAGAATAYARMRGTEYKIGETWTVAAQQLLPTQMRKTAEPRHLEPKAGPPVLLRYEVVALDPRLILELRQVERDGFSVADPRVEKIVIELDEQTEQVSKTYYFRGRAQGVKVSPEGIRSKITPLELFPLDAPVILGAIPSVARSDAALPVLPRPLEQAVRRPVADSRRGQWMDQDDFFGRAVEFLWRDGDPWPAYLKNAQGVTVLVEGAR